MNNIFMLTSRFCISILVAYCLVTCIVFYAFYWKTSSNQLSVPRPIIQIWSKAAIGHYLWFDILNGGRLSVSENKFFIRGTHLDDGIRYHFYSGPGYIQSTLPGNVTRLVLILNGRTPGHVQASSLWLEFLPRLNRLKYVAVVILGNEKCENDWILKHLKKRGGLVDVFFVVYDSTLIDDRDIFQWPLGVSTYRDFPTGHTLDINSLNTRKYRCNFVGTVYQNSSRNQLVNTISSEDFKSKCLVSTRFKWAPKETEESLANYINALNNSDFTLCPVGFNTECYRIYEALSFGSIPVIEDVMTDGQCTGPLRLLKNYGPPFLFVTNWWDLDSVLQSYDSDGIQVLRKNVVTWYAQFKLSMKNKFVSVIKKKFHLN